MRRSHLPVVPLQGELPLPGTATIFETDRKYVGHLLNRLGNKRGRVILANWNQGRSKNPTRENLHSVGVIARIAELPCPGDKALVAVEAIEPAWIRGIEKDAKGLFTAHPLPAFLGKHSETSRIQAG